MVLDSGRAKAYQSHPPSVLWRIRSDSWYPQATTHVEVRVDYCPYCEIKQPEVGSNHYEDCPFHDLPTCLACEAERVEEESYGDTNKEEHRDQQRPH